MPHCNEPSRRLGARARAPGWPAVRKKTPHARCEKAAKPSREKPSSWTEWPRSTMPLTTFHSGGKGSATRAPRAGTRNAALMNRIFDGLKIDQPVQRMNWSLYPNATLYHPYSARSREANPDRHSIDAKSFIRVERQTLRKLPQTGDILFTVRIYLDPLTQLAKHPGAIDRLREYLLALTPAERDYKGLRTSINDIIAIIDKFRAGTA